MWKMHRFLVGPHDRWPEPHLKLIHPTMFIKNLPFASNLCCFWANCHHWGKALTCLPSKTELIYCIMQLYFINTYKDPPCGLLGLLYLLEIEAFLPRLSPLQPLHVPDSCLCGDVPVIYVKTHSGFWKFLWAEALSTEKICHCSIRTHPQSWFVRRWLSTA